MRLTNKVQIDDLLKAINQTRGDVWLVSQQGDRYNMKSALTQYIALGALLGEHGDELELFCDNREDEGILLGFFFEHPEIR